MVAGSAAEPAPGGLMASVGPGDLYELADDLLDACTESLDTIPTFAGLEDLLGAPALRYVSPGAPYPDCCDDGMLAVHVNNITDRFARQNDAGAPKLNVPNLIVTLLRCTQIVNEQGELESVDVMQGHSRQLYADAWALWNHIYNLIEVDQFLTRCGRVVFQSMQSLQTEGGCGGWQLSFLVQLDGYSEVIAT